MDRYCKRLIEVDLPIRRISIHARREKNIRYGHIATMHQWWARRPLAACRAVICASLWPDPANGLCPDVFRHTARSIMKKWAAEHLKQASENTTELFVKIQRNPDSLKDNEVLRTALLGFVADFADWDNCNEPAYLEVAKQLTRVAHEGLGPPGSTKPLVVDPFAGGGSIPFKSLRVGAATFASDLNPVAVLLSKVVLEYIPKYGHRLAEEVHRWGLWIGKQAEKGLMEYYPEDLDRATPIAYLWARTVISESPGDGAAPVEIPLMTSLWLAKKAKGGYALRWVRDSQGRIQTETTEVTYADGRTITVRRPIFEIFTPKKDCDVDKGTVAHGSATSPVDEYTMPIARVREQLRRRRGGTDDARLIAVRKNDPATRRRIFRLATGDDLRAAGRAAIELARRQQVHKGPMNLTPDEPTPRGGGSGAGRAFSQRNYGMDRFADLFTPRQLLALTTFAGLVVEAGQRLSTGIDDDLAVAVQTCLALALDRLADFNSSLCMLNTTGGRGVVHTFGRQALPMVWSFMETNPLNDVAANWASSVQACVSTIENECNKGSDGQASVSSAMCHPLPDDCAHAFITDPPYYDAVPFADLSDFFIVWLRRTIGDKHANLFSEPLSPKEDECIVDEIKDKDSGYFERSMTRAMEEGRRILMPNGIGVVLFAHKSTRGWEAILKAMVEAGWVITGSWPIDTERAGRLRAQNSAALASSIHIVCRPRENPDGSLREDDVGLWRDVLGELPGRIHEWMPRLAEEGIVGADAIFACVGPALEIFSRYSSVEKASGEKVALKEYLEEVWAAVAREALNMIFAGADASGFEEDARLTAMWLWTLRTSSADGSDAGDESEKRKSLRGYSLEYDAARKIAQGLGAHLEKLSHLVEIKGDTATLLAAGARARYLFGKGAEGVPKGRRRKKARQLTLDFGGQLQELEEESGDWASDLSGRAGSTVLDQLHQSMILFGAGRGEALKRFLLGEGVGRNPLFWRLAQALSALYPAGTDEKRWVDGVLGRRKGLGL